MLFVILIIILALMVIVMKRRVGLPILVALVAWFTINLWKLELAQIVRQLGVGWPLGKIAAVIEIAAVVIPTIWMVFYSHPSERGLIRTSLEAVLLGVLVVYVLRGSIGLVLALDADSIMLAGLASQFEKLILTVAGSFALSEVLSQKAS